MPVGVEQPVLDTNYKTLKVKQQGNRELKEEATKKKRKENTNTLTKREREK